MTSTTRILSTTFLLSVAAMTAQDKPTAPAKPANQQYRLLRLEHADPRRVHQLLGDHVMFDDALKAVVIAGTSSEITSLTEAIKQIDGEMANTSTKNVFVTIYILGASGDAGKGDGVPPNLQPVVAQLQAIFPYKAFQLLDSAVVRSGVSLYPAPSVDGSFATGGQYSCHFKISSIAPAAGKMVVHFLEFRFSTRVKDQSPWSGETDLLAQFDAGIDQKIVVGKAGTGEKHALFVVVEAKIAD